MLLTEVIKSVISKRIKAKKVNNLFILVLQKNKAAVLLAVQLQFLLVKIQGGGKTCV